jgi:FAD dependent oxidoreductase TIGR03364
MAEEFDLAVVGAGALGLAHALAAARLGKRVVVFDRDARANGASVQMTGLVTVAGHARGAWARRAKRSRDLWAEVCAEAGIRIEHDGLAIVARRPEAATALEAYAATDPAPGSAFYKPDDAHALFPQFRGDIAGVFWSPDELRVEPKSAIPRIAAWLEEAHRVAFRWETAVSGFHDGVVATSRGPVAAKALVVCPGGDFHTLYGERLASAGLIRAKAQMLRIRYEEGFELPGAVATDLGVPRMPGLEGLDGVDALRSRLEAEQPDHMRHGIVLIAAQSADGTVVVGGSRKLDAAPDTTQSQIVDDLILDELAAVFGRRPKTVVSRWIGTYAFSADRPLVVEAPEENVRVVVAASAAGASAAFAIGEETVADLFG